MHNISYSTINMGYKKRYGEKEVGHGKERGNTFINNSS